VGGDWVKFYIFPQHKDTKKSSDGEFKMNEKDMKRFVNGVLNTSGVRDVLRQKVPEINRLEELAYIRDLRLTRMEAGEESPIFMALYEGIASSDLYPHVRANLIKYGVINRGNVIDSSSRNKGRPDEYESVSFGISGSSIQVVLKAYNPSYKR
jgi:hypothetical protein